MASSSGNGYAKRHPYRESEFRRRLYLAVSELLISNKSKTSCPKSSGAKRALFSTDFYP